MDAEAWERLESVFFAALELPAHERAGFLDRACGKDAALRAEVEAVLAGHERARGKPDEDGLEEGLATGADGEGADPGGHVGRRVGPYRLVELVGRGGMGEVYRARREDDQYRQEVAVKLVRPHLPSDEMARRFRVERQVLARLEHPGIATLLDGGVTEDGSPYLVMQYVDGAPITEYADRRRLPLPARLRLFASVCRTVHFAHTNLVVHRDLKPSNILVTADGRARLLDFGIAKLLDPEGMGITEPFTESRLVLTPEHAAPEQLLGDPVTTATDVYALGVLLYELLTGTRPFRTTLGGGWHRAVCEQDPVRPSVASRTAAAGPVGHDPMRVAEARGTRPPALEQALRGDLDHIVAMALRKEPERRYASAEQLAEDADRYLQGRPVLARRDTLAYRSRKFLRRNRLAVGVAAVTLMVLAAATVVTAHQARARALALAQSEVEREKAEDLAAFMLGVFEANDPASARGEAVTARELLDRSAARIDEGLDRQPLVRADMKVAIGRAYGALGLYAAAQPLFEDALRQRRAQLSDDDPAVAEALDQVGRGLASLGRLDEALPIMHEALAMREATHGKDDVRVASTLTALARMEIDAGEYARARSLLERAVAIHRSQPAPDGRGLANALRFLWLALNWTGEKELELPVAREALAVARASLAEGDPLRLSVLQDYALALESTGQLDSAAAVTRIVLAGRERVQGPDHPDVSYAYHNLGRVLRSLGRLPEALEAYRAGLEIRERALGPEHPAVSHILHSYAIALGDVGEFERAAALEERAIPLLEASFGARHLNTLDSMELLAQLYAVLGRDDEALDLLEELTLRGWSHLAVVEGAPFRRFASDARFERLLERVRSAASPPA